MDHAQFRDWFSRVDELTAAQRKEVAAVPSKPSEGAAALAALDIPHESIDASAGERVRGAVHIQTVDSRHSQIKGFLRGFRSIPAKYLDSYLRWFHLIELGDRPSPRASLEAAMTKPCLQLAN